MQNSIWAEMDSRQQTRVIIFWLVAIALVMGVVSSWQDGHLDWRGLGGNLSTELFGGALTFVVLDRVIGGRREQEAQAQQTGERKAALLRRMSSKIHAEAFRAIEELRGLGWLEDGTLQNQNFDGGNLAGGELSHADLVGASFKDSKLQNANLKEAKLQQARLFSAGLQNAVLLRANLQESNLMLAHLEGANLREATLQGSGMKRVYLQGAELWRANLQDTYLMEANLEGANLSRADLRGANLRDANLRNANLKGAIFDEKTLLPDSTFWTPQTRIQRFTNPARPDFWQSPAYAP